MGLCSLPCCGNVTDVNGAGDLDLSQDIPIKDRKQTDITGLIVLILLLLFLAICVLIAGIQGDIRRLTHGYDDQGNICGFKNEPIEGVKGSGMDFTQEKYLLVNKHCNEYTGECWTEKLCVEECKDGIVSSSLIPQCIADADDKKPNATLRLSFEIVISDIALCWKEIIEICLLSIFISAITLTILLQFPKMSLRILLTVVCVALIGIAVLAWRLCIKMFFIDTKNHDEYEKDMWAQETTFFLASAIIATTLSVMCLLFPCCVKPELKLLPVLFEEGSKCIKDAPMMLLLPVLTTIINSVFTCFAVFGFFYLVTSGKAELDSEGKVTFPNNLFFQITTWVLLFGLFWVSQFFLGCQNLFTAGTASLWYFSRVKGQLNNPVWRSISITAKHHLGSAAFGSIIITIIRPLQFIYGMTQGRNASTAIEPFDDEDYAMCFLRIISKNAYVMIMLLGKPFCTSARRAFDCVISESPIVAFLLPTKALILTIAEIFIAIFVTFVADTLIKEKEGIQIFWIPMCVVFILSLLCCHAFFSVYNMTIDAIILCFCMDHQMNNGLEKPYYMDEKLKVLFNKVDPSTPLLTGNENDVNLPMSKLDD